MIKSKLKKLRTEKELTQEELSHKSGMTLNSIQKLEKDNCNPTLKNCLILKKILNANYIEDIFTDD